MITMLLAGNLGAGVVATAGCRRTPARRAAGGDPVISPDGQAAVERPERADAGAGGGPEMSTTAAAASSRSWRRPCAPGRRGPGRPGSHTPSVSQQGPRWRPTRRHAGICGSPEGRFLRATRPRATRPKSLLGWPGAAGSGAQTGAVARHAGSGCRRHKRGPLIPPGYAPDCGAASPASTRRRCGR